MGRTPIPWRWASNFAGTAPSATGLTAPASACARRMPEIPDFTDPDWQAQRSDAQLVASIRDGKGTTMPPAGDDITEAQARVLVNHVRTFPRTSKEPKQGRLDRTGQDEPVNHSHLSRVSGDRKETPPKYIHLQSYSSNRVVEASHEGLAQAAAGSSEALELFRRDCARCHGTDGTGQRARRRMPEIPDFTDSDWQARRADAQLVASIRDGKGASMPAADDLTEAQARSLVTYVRAFAPAAAVVSQGLIDTPIPTGFVEDEPPAGLLWKIIRWIGKFHPPAVHFPIALITAAAVAEILRMTTGNPNFDTISRYCLWFGSLTAMAAGVLGWFLGGFHMTDSSRVMMIHRWLGTSTVVSALLVLILSEVSRRPDRWRARLCGRLMLFLLAALVSATGFFGGAAVFGLDHYNWPR